MKSIRGHVAGCVVGAIVVAVCSSGHSVERTVAPSTSEPATPSSTSISMTTQPATTVSTRAVVSTTTTVPFAGPPTTQRPEAVGAFVNGRQAPVLGGTTGWHFYVVLGARIFVVDLDTGAITETAIPDSSSTSPVAPWFGQLYAVDNGLFLYASGLVAVDATMKVPPRR